MMGRKALTSITKDKDTNKIPKQTKEPTFNTLTPIITTEEKTKNQKILKRKEVYEESNIFNNKDSYDNQIIQKKR